MVFVVPSRYNQTENNVCMPRLEEVQRQMEFDDDGDEQSYTSALQIGLPIGLPTHLGQPRKSISFASVWWRDPPWNLVSVYRLSLVLASLSLSLHVMALRKSLTKHAPIVVMSYLGLHTRMSIS